jgi:hypothetical protein
MQRNGSGDYDGVDSRIGDQIRCLRHDTNARIATLHLRQTLWTPVRHGRHLRVTQLGKIANQIRPPVAVSDDSDF